MRAIIAAPVTLAMIYRAWSHRSLTPAGLVAATITAIAHAVHPWNLPFALLIVFFLAGTRVTKVKKTIKAQLTLNASGSSEGEGPRTHLQVLANSAMASVLTLMHAYQLQQRESSGSSDTQCFSLPRDMLAVGIIANYAAVAADTFSSELGILSTGRPCLITSFTFRQVPHGTNGGVTIGGLAAGLLGSSIIALISIVLLPFCGSASSILGFAKVETWTVGQKLQFGVAVAIWGFFGSVLDSVLGGLFQSSVVDVRSGRIIEGEGGKRVLTARGPSSHGSQDSSTPAVDFKARPSRSVESGCLPFLDNNDVNFVMAMIMSTGAVVAVGVIWNVPLAAVLRP